MTSKGSKTREKLLQVATRLFSEQGFTSVSFGQIARASKLTSSAVFFHFKNREDLAEAVIWHVIQHCAQLISESIESTDSADQRLRKYFQGNLQWALKFRGEGQIIVLLYYLGFVNPRFSAIYERVRKGAQAKIVEYLHSGLRERVFDFPMEKSHFYTEILHEALMGGIINLISPGHVKNSSIAATQRKWDLLFKELLTGSSHGIKSFRVEALKVDKGK